MAEKKLLSFTMLGPSKAGKTSMLACLNKTFEDVLPGSFSPVGDTFAILQDAYEALEDAAEGKPRRFKTGTVERTDVIKTFDFMIKGKSENIPVRFYDFPGGFISRNASEEDKKAIENLVKSSAAIIVAIDTPYLMENDERFMRKAAIEDIQHVLKMSIDGKQEKLILLVPIKCEKYTETWEGRQELKDKIHRAFKQTLTMAEQNKDKIAIVLLPVHTIGNVKFSHFEPDGNEVFMKKANQTFHPEYTDQPLRYAMSFILEQHRKMQEGGFFSKIFSGIWNWVTDIFSPDNLPDIVSYVYRGINFSDDRFEIIAGRKLLGLRDE